MKWIVYGISVLLTLSVTHGETIDMRGKRVPGLKLTYTSTLVLEQLARRRSKGQVDIEKINVSMHCYKKWKVIGRKNTLTYQCQPYEIEVPGKMPK